MGSGGAAGGREVDADRPRARASLRFRVVARIAWFVLHVLLRLRRRTTGLEHVPERGGVVVTWNHHSHLDFVVTAWEIVYGVGRPVRILAMRELWSHPWLFWMPRLAQCVPVDRATDVGRDAALADAVAALRDGHVVLVAPEGRITPSLELERFRIGPVRMAQLAGVPVVPSASWGTQRISTTGYRAPRLRDARHVPVEVAYGPPLQPAPDDDPVALAATLRDATAELLAEVRARYPDGAPAGARWVPAALGGGAPPLGDDGPDGS